MANIWEKPFTDQSSAFGTGQQANPFYQPGNMYGAEQDYNSSPISEAIREQNPQLAYAQYGNNVGLGTQNDRFQRWFYDQYPDFQRGYGMATMANPLLTIDSYMNTLPSLSALMQRYNMQSPGARGVNDSVFAPSARWINR